MIFNRAASAPPAENCIVELSGCFHTQCAETLISSLPKRFSSVVKAGHQFLNGEKGLKSILSAVVEIRLFNLSFCYVWDFGVCPSDFFQGTGQGVKVAVVLMSGFPEVQDDGRGTALCSKIGEIPERRGEKSKQKGWGTVYTLSTLNAKVPSVLPNTIDVFKKLKLSARPRWVEGRKPSRGHTRVHLFFKCHLLGLAEAEWTRDLYVLRYRNARQQYRPR